MQKDIGLTAKNLGVMGSNLPEDTLHAWQAFGIRLKKLDVGEYLEYSESGAGYLAGPWYPPNR